MEPISRGQAGPGVVKVLKAAKGHSWPLLVTTRKDFFPAYKTEPYFLA